MRSEQLDIKLLLKQVYQAHTTKIKGLEDEVEALKSKLYETDKKLKNSETECKRCGELEEAFKSCQAALNEQSKWFENLGQKFSVFDHPESKAPSNKTTNDSNNISKNYGEVSCSSQLSCLLPDKSSSAKMNLLKNLMSLSPEEYQDSLDLGTAPFPAHFAQDYSTLNSDSMILAPDTVDLVAQVQSETKVKDTCKNPEEKVDAEVSSTKNKIVLQTKGNNRQSHKVDGIMKECQMPSKLAKKRTLTASDASENKTKRLHKSSTIETDCPSEIKKHRSDNKNDISEALPNAAKSMKEKKSPNEGKQTKNPNTISGTSKALIGEGSGLNAKNKSIPELDIQVCHDASNGSRKSLDKTKETLSSSTSTTMKNSIYQVSPSLLPINDKKDKTVPARQLLENEDIYDFQTPIASKKTTLEEDGSWTVCDKKKLKKGPPLKVKTSSKFKLSLDVLPPNYKKPVYRQTKLSKTIFQAKVLNTNTSKENIPDSSASPSLTRKDIGIGKNTVDFDATCIPDNYEYQIIPSGSGIQEAITNNEEDVILLNSDSMEGSSSDSSLLITENCNNKSKESRCLANNEDEDNFEDFLQDGHKKLVCGENMNSFDRLPKKEEPNYKYKEETVRKRAERKQLNAFDCKECEKYYAELGLSDKEKQNRLKQCSRHRSKFAPPPTPEHFWELEFPDTQECKARGYLNETQKGKLKTHRRKPL